ncbi:MAG: hypothetical protein MUC36_02965 [Planctomycetes bacterium]|jgi:hypothetical protein|nr:hypothetical protein [Planctomycetota bacterium]
MTRFAGLSHRFLGGSLPSVLVCLAVLAACETGDPSRSYGVGAAQYQDVVVPAGLKLREGGHESYSRDEAGWRQAHLVYSGQTRVEEAANYVRQRMPQHNWSMVASEELEGGVVKLRFERSVYTADYTFVRADGATQMVVDYATDYTRR